MKPCYTIDEYRTLGEILIFEGFHDPKRLLNTDNYFLLKKGQPVNKEVLRRGKEFVPTE